MKATFEYYDVDQAIKILQKIKKSDKKGKKRRIIISTIDFDKEIEVRKTATPDEGCVLVKNAKTIVFNDDQFIPHMELYSILQDIDDIRRCGIMHDIILCSG
ncbi:hypothetical protein GKG47_09175 [Lactonifactor sp. BIOML-A3]|uniref:hypothetical protein n=1 Tax=unclassified Lactonifactor TaxID=2636670 RepID=UPI0012B08F6F|nr:MULTISPECIES: hypothetical protein [unclassified Lactonifactor]MSA02209.1 hypothetical protein [Lactonifactor sp. BIOML-A5]MSA07994.1 hypothetical protein [Lactonifactor sp. BIOML-A4]MSA12610.1 hypothetical protein [Lactonifactor sp. BIOML-A3]MSA16689.1 hypothetical protein [Lactonifactor sp. BIOML-A2]MSA37612.1 hypothetical protein [Lactonifactor sp. BIOML-A1]